MFLFQGKGVKPYSDKGQEILMSGCSFLCNSWYEAVKLEKPRI